MSRESTVCASKCAKVVAGAGSVRSPQGHSCLHGRDRPFVVDVMPCNPPISVAKVGWYLRMGRAKRPPSAPACGSGDVVHEEQHVLTLLIAEVFRNREAGEGYRARAPGGSFIWPYTSAALEPSRESPLILMTPDSIISW